MMNPIVPAWPEFMGPGVLLIALVCCLVGTLGRKTLTSRAPCRPHPFEANISGGNHPTPELDT